MKKNKSIVVSAIFLFLMVSSVLFAAPEEKVEKTFDKKEEIRFKLVLGDCHLKKSSDNRIHVHLAYSYEPDMSYEPKLRERRNVLYLEEEMHGKNPRGYSKWTVAVPDGIEIEFKSATGNLLVEGLNIEIDGKTGTGDIELANIKGKVDVSTGTGSVEVYDSDGDFEVSSGTGKVRIKNSRGNFDASSGTGDVEAEGLNIDFEGDFKSGTSDVEVAFPDGTDFELTLASGTDDAVLHMKGKPIQGYFEFKCHARRGRIISPVQFDSEEEYEQNGQEYLQKSFTKGKDKPKVYIKTGTGTAKLTK